MPSQIPPSYASSGGSDAKAYAVDPKDRMAMHSLVDAESLGNFVHARTGDSTHRGEDRRDMLQPADEA